MSRFTHLALLATGCALILWGWRDFFFSAQLFSDLAALHFDYAEKRWFFENLRQGELTLLYPFNELGHALLANPASGLIFLPNLLHVVLPFDVAYKILIFAHYLLLFLGWWRLLAHFTTSERALALSAVAMSLGLSFSLPVHVTLGYASFFPWAISAVYELWNKERRIALGVFTSSALFLLGDPLLVPAAWGLGTLLGFKSSELRRVLRSFFIVSVLTILVCAPHLYIMLMEAPYNARAQGIDPREALSYSTAPIRVLDWLFPALKLYEPSEYMGAGLNDTWWFPYLGGGLALTFLVFMGLKARTHRCQLVGWGAGFVLLALGYYFPPSAWLFEHAPVLKYVRFPERFLVYAWPALMILMALGLRSLPRRWVYVVLAVALAENLLLRPEARVSELVDLPQTMREVWRGNEIHPTRLLVCERGFSGEEKLRYFDVRAQRIAMVNGTSNTRSAMLKSVTCPWALSPTEQRWLGISHVLTPNAETASVAWALTPLAELPGRGQVLVTEEASPLRAFGEPGKWSCGVPSLTLIPDKNLQGFMIKIPSDCSGQLILPWAYHTGWQVSGGATLERYREATISLKVSSGTELITVSYAPAGAKGLVVFSFILQLLILATIVGERTKVGARFLG
jgi:hypothetical protein